MSGLSESPYELRLFMRVRIYARKQLLRSFINRQDGHYVDFASESAEHFKLFEFTLAT